MKVLITGASGLLGKSLIETAPNNCELSATYNANYQQHTDKTTWYNLNVRSRSDVFDRFDLIKPNIVIHCAAIGSVDYSEDHYDETREVNVTGLKHIVDAANGYKSKVVYISTNAVYSGKKPPYGEKSALEPVNAYGVIKREAEQLVRDIAKKWLIFRPFMLYGWPNQGGRTNWAVKIIGDLRDSKKSLSLVDDVVWMPTYALDCAETIWKLLFQKEINHEIFNVAAPERATLYQFGLKVCEVFGLEKNLLKPVQSEYFSVGTGVAAKRPKDTSYDLLKLSQEGIMLSDIKTGLEKMKND
jgi:dTDP-4-dehydrorhamnose reductase